MDAHLRAPRSTENAIFVRFGETKSIRMMLAANFLMVLSYGMSLSVSDGTLDRVNRLMFKVALAMLPFTIYMALKKPKPVLAVDELGLGWFASSDKWWYCDWPDLESLDLKPAGKAFQICAASNDGKRRWSPFPLTVEEMEQMRNIVEARSKSALWSDRAQEMLSELGTKKA